VIDILLSALAERDFVAQGHAERLSRMAEMIAGRLHLSDEERKNLILLAKVHDMGKVGIPDKILFKPRKLSEEEFEKMKGHAQIGYNLASRSKELFHIAHLILHHHEFWDGNGYTHGLKGEQIPLECRVFSIIDAFDTMTNTRPYRKGISKKRAIKELKRCAGTQFEPKLVDEFVEFVE
jgi:HD-GYP domain-containing protein (c-di-GMP phosphodiesterase class II)